MTVKFTSTPGLVSNRHTSVLHMELWFFIFQETGATHVFKKSLQ